MNTQTQKRLVHVTDVVNQLQVEGWISYAVMSTTNTFRIRLTEYGMLGLALVCLELIGTSLGANALQERILMPLHKRSYFSVLPVTLKSDLGAIKAAILWRCCEIITHYAEITRDLGTQILHRSTSAMNAKLKELLVALPAYDLQAGSLTMLCGLATERNFDEFARHLGVQLTNVPLASPPETHLLPTDGYWRKTGDRVEKLSYREGDLLVYENGELMLVPRRILKIQMACVRYAQQATTAYMASPRQMEFELFAQNEKAC